MADDPRRTDGAQPAPLAAREASHSERISAVIAYYLDAQAIPIMHEVSRRPLPGSAWTTRSSSSTTAARTTAGRCCESWRQPTRAPVDALRPGTLMLTQSGIGDTSAQPSVVNLATGLVPVQRLAPERILARFDLKIIDRAPGGLAIVRLLPRS